MNAFRKDLISGTIVGVIAIPLGMAFAIASGVKPSMAFTRQSLPEYVFHCSEDQNFKLVGQQVLLFLSCLPLRWSMAMRTCLSLG